MKLNAKKLEGVISILARETTGACTETSVCIGKVGEKFITVSAWVADEFRDAPSIRPQYKCVVKPGRAK